MHVHIMTTYFYSDGNRLSQKAFHDFRVVSIVQLRWVKLHKLSGKRLISSVYVFTWRL